MDTSIVGPEGASAPKITTLECVIAALRAQQEILMLNGLSLAACELEGVIERIELHRKGTGRS